MATIGERADPRVRRTRDLIQRAFMELLEERGFEAIRVQDIAERATINRATFYAHFEDKYNLLDTLIHERFQRELTELLPSGSALTASNLRTLATAVFTLLDQVEGHCKPADHEVRPVFEAALQRELSEFLLGWLRRAAPSGAAPSAEIAASASAMSWAIFGAAVEWTRDARRLPQATAVDQVISMLIDGVARTTHIAIPL